MTDSPNYYHDTDHRMEHDADFRSSVMSLVRMAQEFGYTPGELKQIAFRAALEIEMRKPVAIPVSWHQASGMDKWLWEQQLDAERNGEKK